MSKTKFRLNPCSKFILVVIVSLEVSIKPSLVANCSVIILALFYLIWQKIKFRHLLELICIPLIAAISTFCSVYFYAGHNLYDALNLFSRVYVYTWSAACIGINSRASDFVQSLTQNFHLPSKFAYGCLAAIGIVPQTAANVKKIRAAGMMRGVYLSFWSPSLYFKAIITALADAENLAQGMESHGFVEGQKRSVIRSVPLRAVDYGLSIFLLFIFNILLFSFK